MVQDATHAALLNGSHVDFWVQQIRLTEAAEVTGNKGEEGGNVSESNINDAELFEDSDDESQGGTPAVPGNDRDAGEFCVSTNTAPRPV
jgi:hypothetical protein